MTKSKTIVANWKMNGSLALVDSVVGGLVDKLSFKKSLNTDIIICPPYPYLITAREKMAGSILRLGAQDCSPESEGSYTGDVSASMLQNVGVSHVILGHSERRTSHGESSVLVAQKVRVAQASNLTTIVCIGESKEERDRGKTLDVLRAQIDHSLFPDAIVSQTIIAYEPIWAIGTGITPISKEVNEIHRTIHEYLYEKFQTYEPIPLLYGGSVQSTNAGLFMDQPFIDGVLVGGASLDLGQFSTIAFS